MRYAGVLAAVDEIVRRKQQKIDDTRVVGLLAAGHARQRLGEFGADACEVFHRTEEGIEFDWSHPGRKRTIDTICKAC